jgi:pyruvate kinase
LLFIIIIMIASLSVFVLRQTRREEEATAATERTLLQNYKGVAAIIWTVEAATRTLLLLQNYKGVAAIIWTVEAATRTLQLLQTYKGVAAMWMHEAATKKWTLLLHQQQHHPILT